MRKILSLLLLTLVVVACSSEGSTFKIDGCLMNLNQGEFYVYSPDGVIDGIDTIFVMAGRFNYKTPCDREGTLVIVFPNFSEQPVFTEPGKSVKMSGDVSHLRELTVTGTKENKLMNAFRAKSKDTAPEALAAEAREFILAHPESLTAIYLVNRYFLSPAVPDYAGASALLDSLLAAQPDNGRLAQNAKKIKARAATDEGVPLPAFSAETIDGDTITQSAFATGSGVIYVWASFDYESSNIQRTLRDSNDSLTLLGICLDAGLRDCRRTLKRDRIATATVCDGMMFEGALVQQLGMSTVPDNLIIEDGVIVARGMPNQQLRERFTKNKN